MNRREILVAAASIPQGAFDRPFSGNFPASNLFDHDGPKEFGDANRKFAVRGSRR